MAAQSLPQRSVNCDSDDGEQEVDTTLVVAAATTASSTSSSRDERGKLCAPPPSTGYSLERLLASSSYNSITSTTSSE